MPELSEEGDLVPSTQVTWQDCPKCQTSLPIYKDYSSWCHSCGWNLNISLLLTRPKNIFEVVYARVGKNLSEKLFNEMKQVGIEGAKPRLTFSKFMAYLFAGLVHIVTVVLLVVGLVIIVLGWPSFLAIFVGVAFLIFGWFLRPRWPKLSKGNQLSRKEFPALFSLVNRVAQVIGTSSVDYIRVTPEFNASIMELGWRSQKVLTIGLPLFSILNEQERIALLSHELGHCVNGDPGRGFFIKGALNSLIEWYNILRPGQRVKYGSARRAVFAGIANLITNFFLAFLSSLVKWAILVLSQLIWRSSQRAEYLADAKAAQISGTQAMTSMLGKLYFSDTYALTVQRYTLGKKKNYRFFDNLHRIVEQVPQREIERIKLLSRLAYSRLDATHPPTVYRVNFLSAHFTEGAKICLSDSERDQLEKELNVLRDRIEEKIMDKYLNSLYY